MQQRTTAAVAISAGLLVAGAPPASAADSLTPGTPGTAGWVGRAISVLAQAGENGLLGTEEVRGLDGLGVVGRPAPEQAAVARDFCGRLPAPA